MRLNIDCMCVQKKKISQVVKINKCRNLSKYVVKGMGIALFVLFLVKIGCLWCLYPKNQVCDPMASEDFKQQRLKC